LEGRAPAIALKKTCKSILCLIKIPVWALHINIPEWKNKHKSSKLYNLAKFLIQFSSPFYSKQAQLWVVVVPPLHLYLYRVREVQQSGSQTNWTSGTTRNVGITNQIASSLDTISVTSNSMSYNSQAHLFEILPDHQPVRLLVSASPNQPANSIFLSQKTSTSTNSEQAPWEVQYLIFRKKHKWAVGHYCVKFYVLNTTPDQISKHYYKPQLV